MLEALLPAILVSYISTASAIVIAMTQILKNILKDILGRDDIYILPRWVSVFLSFLVSIPVVIFSVYPFTAEIAIKFYHYVVMIIIVWLVANGYYKVGQRFWD